MFLKREKNKALKWKKKTLVRIQHGNRLLLQISLPSDINIKINRKRFGGNEKKMFKTELAGTDWVYFRYYKDDDNNNNNKC